jgi:hypothetical protein
MDSAAGNLAEFRQKFPNLNYATKNTEHLNLTYSLSQF